MGSPHLTHDQIAQLTAGSLSEVHDEVRAHLESCRECREAVRETNLWHAEWASQPDGFADPVRAKAASDEFLHQLPSRRRTGASPGRRWAIGAVSVVAVAVLAFVVLKPVGRHDRADLPFSIAPVTTAIRETAFTGRVLVPGAEVGPVTKRGAYRSGYAETSGEVEETLHRMAEAYLGTASSSDLAAALVAGYLAAGHVSSARDFVLDARRRFPDDDRFQLLEGLVCYDEGRLAEAEEILRGAVARNPGDPVATLNLAQLLSDTGRGADAATMAREIRNSTHNPVLIARADSILVQNGQEQ